MHLIMTHIVISVLDLDSTLQTLLTSFNMKTFLNVRPNGLRVRKLSNNPEVTAVNSVGDNLVSQLNMESTL